MDRQQRQFVRGIERGVLGVDINQNLQQNRIFVFVHDIHFAGKTSCDFSKKKKSTSYTLETEETELKRMHFQQWQYDDYDGSIGLNRRSCFVNCLSIV